MIFCNECIHFGVCMGFYKCKRFERRENANMRITGYESENGEITAITVTDETRGFYDKRFIEDRPHGEWTVRHDTMYHFECPFCKYLHQYKDNFCPCCGADMSPKEGEAAWKSEE